ncbi:MAG: peptidylprolyl isomerase [Clostridia bacterium]|nr:peptidylprolyl isomerase [Clostridia bacterium]
MRKRMLLALVLVLAMVVSSGCSLIVKDEAVDRATPIIEVMGRTFTKGEVQEQIEYIHDYYESMYSYYGMSYDRTAAETIETARTSAIDSMVYEAVVTAKMAEGGYDQLTAEELAEIEAKVEEDYQVYYDSVELFSFSGSDLTGEELEKAIVEEMAVQGYPTKEELLESEKLTLAENKLFEDVVKDVVISDEEFSTEYQLRVEAAKNSYESMASSYSTDLTNGATIYYTPAGYRMVKHILIGFTDEDSAAISDLESQIAVKKNAALTAEDDAAKEAANAEAAELETQLEAAKATAYANIQPTVDEVAAKIAAGEDFDALIEQYNTDPGAATNPDGYAVSAASTNWVAEFQDASMALANVGDVSEAVNTEYGVHFIKYASDVAEGPVAEADVKDALVSELLTTKQNALYNSTVDQWIADADAKIYTDRLN